MTTLAVAGCSGQNALWEGSETGSSSGAATESVYYAGSDNLPLYGEPSASKPPRARLPLHTKVVRDKIEKGYARVKVDGTGETGWVVNSKLIWKLPSSGKTATPSKAPSAPPSKAPSPPPEAKAQTPAPAAAPAAVDTPASDVPGTPAKKAADPSIFDAF